MLPLPLALPLPLPLPLPCPAEEEEEEEDVPSSIAAKHDECTRRGQCAHDRKRSAAAITASPSDASIDDDDADDDDIDDDKNAADVDDDNDEEENVEVEADDDAVCTWRAYMARVRSDTQSAPRHSQHARQSKPPHSGAGSIGLRQRTRSEGPADDDHADEVDDADAAEPGDEIDGPDAESNELDDDDDDASVELDETETGAPSGNQQPERRRPSTLANAAYSAATNTLAFEKPHASSDAVNSGMVEADEDDGAEDSKAADDDDDKEEDAGGAGASASKSTKNRPVWRSYLVTLAAYSRRSAGHCSMTRCPR